MWFQPCWIQNWKWDFFNEENLIKQSYCWFDWLQHHEPKQLKTKESLMEGSQGEAADRKHQKTDSGSTKAKYFAFLNEESSCSADNSSQSEEDPYVKAILMVATYLNELKCKRNVCPLQV